MSQRSGKETPPEKLLRFLELIVDDAFMIVFRLGWFDFALQWHCTVGAMTSE
jgi:hypothetical protein